MKFPAHLFFALSAVLAPFAAAQSVLVYDATGAVFTPSTVAAHITAGNLSLTPGTTLSGFTASGDEYFANGWTTSSSPVESSSYVFTLTADSGYTINLTNISFSFKAQGSGPDNVTVDYSSGSPSVNSRALFSISQPTMAYSFPDTQNATGNYSHSGNLTVYGGQTYSFYILGYNAGQPGKSLTIDTITLQGTVTAVPEPTTAAMLFGAAALTGVMIRRRRARG